MPEIIMWRLLTSLCLLLPALVIPQDHPSYRRPAIWSGYNPRNSYNFGPCGPRICGTNGHTYRDFESSCALNDYNLKMILSGQREFEQTDSIYCHPKPPPPLPPHRSSNVGYYYNSNYRSLLMSHSPSSTHSMYIPRPCIHPEHITYITPYGAVPPPETYRQPEIYGLDSVQPYPFWTFHRPAPPTMPPVSYRQPYWYYPTRRHPPTKQPCHPEGPTTTAKSYTTTSTTTTTPEPSTSTSAEPTSSTSTEPSTSTSTEPSTSTSTEASTSTSTEPTTSTSSESSTSTSTEPATSTSTEPSTSTSTEPVTSPSTEAVPSTSTEPIRSTSTSTKTSTSTSTEPATSTSTEPATSTSTETSTTTSTEPATSTATQPATSTWTEPTTSTSTKTSTSRSTKPSTSTSTEPSTSTSTQASPSTSTEVTTTTTSDPTNSTTTNEAATTSSTDVDGAVSAGIIIPTAIANHEVTISVRDDNGQITRIALVEAGMDPETKEPSCSPVTNILVTTGSTVVFQISGCILEEAASPTPTTTQAGLKNIYGYGTEKTPYYQWYGSSYHVLQY
ncbi:cell wall protein DAN4 isoform X2 [Drosophila serrata]|uniref:cell wall protein DAN4 isoform X2 n=1 Tax=Drosophila serrata TaxID=7274 RepID=UPI000A1D1C29|nr:cell wall protein DAN4 isoform X2 [Drosophila serrata]